MSLDHIQIDRVHQFLQQPSIVDGVSTIEFNADIQGALQTYLDKRELWVLKFLVWEEEFANALYSVLTEDKSIDTLNNICDYLLIHKPEQDMLFLEERYFGRTWEFCDHFWSETAYCLNNKQIAKIIAKWPDYTPQSTYIPIVRSYGYVDIQEKTLVSEFYFHKATRHIESEENKVKLQWDWKRVTNFSRPQEHIIFELNRLFADKTMYEVFGVDPLIVLNQSTKK
jgi:hypothetical protein